MTLRDGLCEFILVHFVLMVNWRDRADSDDL